MKLKVGDEVFFTDDDWTSKYKGKIKEVNTLIGYYRVSGRKYGSASCSENQVKLISKNET